MMILVIGAVIGAICWEVGKRIGHWLMFNYGPRKSDGETT